MTLRMGFAIYFAHLFLYIIVFSACTYYDIGGISLITYIACGVSLNRKILRNMIEYHPMYNTLDNVVSDKVMSIIIWPLGYFGLLVKLTLNRYI